MMAAASKVMRELAVAGVDKRFSLTQSGPMLPFGNFSMYQAVTFAAKNGQGAALVTERGTFTRWMQTIRFSAFQRLHAKR